MATDIPCNSRDVSENLKYRGPALALGRAAGLPGAPEGLPFVGNCAQAIA